VHFQDFGIQPFQVFLEDFVQLSDAGELLISHLRESGPLNHTHRGFNRCLVLWSDGLDRKRSKITLICQVTKGLALIRAKNIE
jgi:hypothetical protein